MFEEKLSVQIQAKAKIPIAPAYLGAAGLAPFALAMLITLFGTSPAQRAFGLQAFAIYSGVILSFLGGVRWGAALAHPSIRLLSMAVLPSLVAAGCLLLPPQRALPLLAIAFLALGLSDATRGAHPLWPQWFKRLRLMLTVAVVALHAVICVATQVCVATLGHL